MALGCSQSCQVLCMSEQSHRALVPHRAQQCWGWLGSLVLRDGPQLRCEQLCPCAVAGLEYSSKRKSVHSYLCPAQPWKSHFTSYKRI